MALPTSGPISSSQIATELVVSNTNFSANSAELLEYTDLNTLSISSSGNILNIDIPNSMSEWYGYNHSFKVSGSNFTSSVSLDAPYNASYPYTTFAQVEMGTTSSILRFTGSNFILSGIAPTSSVPYSIYYAPYSSTMTSSRQPLQNGVLSPSFPSDKFFYTYNASSGSIITFLFKLFPTASPAPIPTVNGPYVKYDQGSSSISSTGTWTNLGTGGATYNLKLFNGTAAVSSSGTGTGSYVSLNTGSVENQYASCSGFNIGAKDFTISTVFRVTKWFDSTVDVSLRGGGGGRIMSLMSSSIAYTSADQLQGVLIEPWSVISSTSPQGGYSVPTYSASKWDWGPTPSIAINTWYHFTSVFNSTSSTHTMYFQNHLYSTYDIKYPGSIPTSKLTIGAFQCVNYKPMNFVGVHLAYLAIWTGSMLTSGQISTLNDEYKSRYPLYSNNT